MLGRGRLPGGWPHWALPTDCTLSPSLRTCWTNTLYCSHASGRLVQPQVHEPGLGKLAVVLKTTPECSVDPPQRSHKDQGEMGRTSGVGWDGGGQGASIMGKAAHATRDRKKTAGGLRLLRTGEASSTFTHSSLKQPYTEH